MIYKILLMANVVTSVAAQLLLKFGMKRIGVVGFDAGFLEKIKKMSLSPFIWLAVLSFGVSFVLYAIVLSKMELSRSYPVAIVSGVVLIYVLSILLFNETATVIKVIGLVLCIVGVVFLLR